MPAQPLFANLVVDEDDRAVGAAVVGGVPFYVVDDAGFRRHVESATIDRAVLRELRRQIEGHEEVIAEQAMKMTGQDDLFTKAMIDRSLKNLDEHFDLLIESGLPEGAREWLGMMGFKIVVNYRGELLKVEQPGAVEEE